MTTPTDKLAEALRKQFDDAQREEVFEAINGTGIIYTTAGLPRRWIGGHVALVKMP